MSENSEGVKLAAKLLLEGAKMLSVPCPICRNPIYQLRNDTLYCSTCRKEIVRESSDVEIANSKITQSENHDDPIGEKIKSLSKELLRETDLDQIVKLAETIKKLKKIQEEQ